ncbi:N-acetyl-gamma-glutamyl-phosphate reductase [Batrachochytrium salamandrivorans]|nr:N-acetyl-gamma-glutamyl-phosphate reductase [Batrachochytrium salamandrivorans]
MNKKSSQLLISLLGPESFKRKSLEYVQAARPCFAILKLGGEVVQDELEILTETCAFLTQEVGPQMNKELAKRGVQPQYIRGNRVTDEKTLEVAVQVFTELNQRVCESFARQGIAVKGFANGVFQAELSSPEMGFVGQITGVNKQPILTALQNKQVPVMTSLGFSAKHPELNINADVAARELALAIQPNRVIYTSAKGGWVDDTTKQIVPKIVLERDYAKLAGLNYEGRQGTLLKLNEIKQLLEGLPREGSAVTISSCPGILTELFGQTGSGSGSTFVLAESSQGKFMHFASIGAADTARVAKLFPGVDFAQLQAGLAEVVVLEDYSSGAIVSNGGVLHTLANPSTQLGQAIKSNIPALAWFATKQNKDLVPTSTLLLEDGRVAAWYGMDQTKALELLRSPVPVDTKLSSQWTTGAQATAVKGKETGKKDIRVGLVGARGYVGREIVKLIANHPRLELVLASSRALVGKSVAKEFNVPNMSEYFLFETLEGSDLETHPMGKAVDVWVLALPNGLAPKWVSALDKLAKPPLIIDLGADYRFTDEWTYGLPERKGARTALQTTRRIANPGCYATGAQVALMPLIHHGLIAPTEVPTIYGLSGYSGAGTNPSDKNNPLVLRDNVIPYALTGHIHEREVGRQLGHRVAFMPHVAPYFQGIALTVSTHVTKKLTTKEFLEMYETFYQNEPMVRVSATAPLVRDNMTQHFAAVGGFTFDEKNQRLAVHATIDNLLKGAASQAIQNINIALGLEDEFAGLPLKK